MNFSGQRYKHVLQKNVQFIEANAISNKIINNQIDISSSKRRAGKTTSEVWLTCASYSWRSSRDTERRFSLLSSQSEVVVVVGGWYLWWLDGCRRGLAVNGLCIFAYYWECCLGKHHLSAAAMIVHFHFTVWCGHSSVHSVKSKGISVIFNRVSPKKEKRRKENTDFLYFKSYGNYRYYPPGQITAIKSKKREIKLFCCSIVYL